MKKIINLLIIITLLLILPSISFSSLVGIDYISSSSQYGLREYDIASGNSTLLNTFSFDSSGFKPGTFNVDSQLNRAYVVSAFDTLYEFDLTDGSTLSNKSLDTSVYSNLDLGNNGSLIGIDYISSVSQYGLREYDIASGNSTLLNTFSFDSSGFKPGTFNVDSQLNRAYVVSAFDTLYEFDLTDGSTLSTKSLDTSVYSNLDLGNNSSLIGIDYISSVSQYGLREYDIASGNSTLLNTFSFDSSGFKPGTFNVDSQLNRAYVVSAFDTLYEFDLTDGSTLSNKSLDTSVYSNLDLHSTNTIIPEPISSILFVAGGSLLAGRRYIKRMKKA